MVCWPWGKSASDWQESREPGSRGPGAARGEATGSRGRGEARTLEGRAFPAFGQRQQASERVPPSGDGAPPRLGGSSLARLEGPLRDGRVGMGASGWSCSIRAGAVFAARGCRGGRGGWLVGLSAGSEMQVAFKAAAREALPYELDPLSLAQIGAVSSLPRGRCESSRTLRNADSRVPQPWGAEAGFLVLRARGKVFFEH